VRSADNKVSRFSGLDLLGTTASGIHAEGRWMPEGGTDDDAEGRATVAVASACNTAPSPRSRWSSSFALPRAAATTISSSPASPSTAPPRRSCRTRTTRTTGANGRNPPGREPRDARPAEGHAAGAALHSLLHRLRPATLARQTRGRWGMARVDGGCGSRPPSGRAPASAGATRDRRASHSAAHRQGDDSRYIEVASSAGFEPTAPGLGILCSILLSYEDTGL
jgi:hypothetical protein